MSQAPFLARRIYCTPMSAASPRSTYRFYLASMTAAQSISAVIVVQSQRSRALVISRQTCHAGKSRRSSALEPFHDAFRANYGPAKQLRGLLGKFKPCSLHSGYMIAVCRKSSLAPQYLKTANSSHRLTYDLRRECTVSSIIPFSTPRINTSNTAIRLSRIRRETS